MSVDNTPNAGVPPPDDIPAAWERALGASRFLQRALVAEGFGGAQPAAWGWLRGLAQVPWSAERIKTQYRENRGEGRGTGADAEAVARALRRTRRQLLCALLLRDCAGLAPLEEITASMTALAELAVRELLAALAPDLAAGRGAPVDAAGRPQDLLVLAMGKAGSGELNVSSDLDLIFVYGESDGGQEFFDRLGRRLIAALGGHEADGFVFRIDMRLRPHGDAGPLVVSIPMLEEYFLREGREWERFAWAKARLISVPVLADRAAFAEQAAALEAVVEPFVYRKYFDFGAIGAIRDLHRRIGAESRRRARGRPERERNVKLGRGGIREIEFLAQTYCIMRGGRDHRLRARGTVATLRTLAQMGLLAPAEAERLADDYRFLRRLEHALQYRDDAQTHAIPAGEDEQAAVACLLGMDSARQMLERYEAVSADVARSFDSIFPAEAGAAADGSAGATAGLSAEALAQSGFADAEAAAARVRQLIESPRVQAMSAAGRAAVENLAGQAVQIIARRSRAGSGDDGTSADELLLRWIRLVEVIGRRSTYFSLLAEYRRAHERVIDLLAAGGWPTEYLLRHPILLDELIDPRTRAFADGHALDDVAPVPGAAEPFWKPWIAETEAQLLAAGDDVERQMNVLRDAHHAQVFRLLLADLGGALQLEHLADHLSALADAVVELALRAAWRGMDAARPVPPATVAAPLPRMAVIAYGKLGGRELGYASDLDLAFVYEESADRPAADREAAACTQLARRLFSWLTTATSSGILFEIDLRLRPNGNAGMLVTPLAAFDRYQSNADGHGAWVWEHQALTRARACAGDAQVGAQVERIRARVLRQERDPAALAGEVLAMRLRMLEGHVNRSDRFDLKHDRGGMVDIEFTVQYLVLAHAHRHEALVANRGNIGLLSIAADLGLIDAALARDCAAAYRRYRRLQHALRLNGLAHARVERGHVQAEIDAVLRLWRGVFGTDQPLPAAPAAAR
jgi:glutamate-ammonia-ligase adenylyltransferase